MPEFRKGARLDSFRGDRFDGAEYVYVEWPNVNTLEVEHRLVKVAHRRTAGGGIMVELENGYRMPVKDPKSCCFAVPV